MSPITKLIILGVVVIVVGAFLWLSIIPSYFRNSSYDAPYTSLTLRDGMNNTVTLDFGDTEYTLTYSSGYLSDYTFIETATVPYTHLLHAGDVYREFGIEIDVSKVSSDYISNYVVILVRPTIQNYMASLFYTKVNMTLYQSQAVNISSGLTNEKHLYWFTYTPSPYGFSNIGRLEVQNSSQRNYYDVYVGRVISYGDNSDIEIRVFKLESQYMVIYVKPLY
jgi:hypothetical protein